MSTTTEFDNLNLEIDTSSPAELIKQMAVNPVYYAYYGAMLEDAKYDVAQTKVALEKERADCADALRQADPKLSESKISMCLNNTLSCVELQMELNNRKRKEGKLVVILKALEQRATMLMTISGLKRQELKQLSEF